MARSAVDKSQTVDETHLAGAARLRARTLAILGGALRASGLDQSALAQRVGVRKAAVSSLLRGNGNIRIDTLGEYLAALGFEADLTVVPLGEIEKARNERRAPRHVSVTIADRDRVNNPNGELNIISLPSSDVSSDRTRNAMLAAFQVDATNKGDRQAIHVIKTSGNPSRNLRTAHDYRRIIGARG